MTIREKVQAINSIIAKEKWLDMEIFHIKGVDLSIIGSIDFTYGHSVEITFIDVFHMSINAEWQTDTSKPVLEIVSGEEEYNVNGKYRIQEGNILFKIASEDLETPFYIAAKDIKFNSDRVLYYKKDNLDDGERMADWVR